MTPARARARAYRAWLAATHGKLVGQPAGLGQKPAVVLVLLDAHAPFAFRQRQRDNLVGAVGDGELGCTRPVSLDEAAVVALAGLVIDDDDAKGEEDVTVGHGEGPGLGLADASVFVGRETQVRVDLRGAGLVGAPVQKVVDRATRGVRTTGSAGSAGGVAASVDASLGQSFAELPLGLGLIYLAGRVVGGDAVAGRLDFRGASRRIDGQRRAPAAGGDVAVVVAGREPGDERPPQDEEEESEEPSPDDGGDVAVAVVAVVVRHDDVDRRQNRRRDPTPTGGGSGSHRDRLHDGSGRDDRGSRRRRGLGLLGRFLLALRIGGPNGRLIALVLLPIDAELGVARLAVNFVMGKVGMSCDPGVALVDDGRIGHLRGERVLVAAHVLVDDRHEVEGLVVAGIRLGRLVGRVVTHVVPPGIDWRRIHDGFRLVRIRIFRDVRLRDGFLHLGGRHRNFRNGHDRRAQSGKPLEFCLIRVLLLGLVCQGANLA